MPRKDVDKIISEALSGLKPAYKEDFWRQLEAKLPPVKPRQRYWPFALVLIPILGISGWFATQHYDFGTNGILSKESGMNNEERINAESKKQTSNINHSLTATITDENGINNSGVTINGTSENQQTKVMNRTKIGDAEKYQNIVSMTNTKTHSSTHKTQSNNSTNTGITSNFKQQSSINNTNNQNQSGNNQELTANNSTFQTSTTLQDSKHNTENPSVDTLENKVLILEQNPIVITKDTANSGIGNAELHDANPGESPDKKIKKTMESNLKQLYYRHWENPAMSGAYGILNSSVYDKYTGIPLKGQNEARDIYSVEGSIKNNGIGVHYERFFTLFSQLHVGAVSYSRIFNLQGGARLRVGAASRYNYKELNEKNLYFADVLNSNQTILVNPSLTQDKLIKSTSTSFDFDGGIEYEKMNSFVGLSVKNINQAKFSYISNSPDYVSREYNLTAGHSLSVNSASLLLLGNVQLANKRINFSPQLYTSYKNVVTGIAYKNMDLNTANGDLMAYFGYRLKGLTIYSSFGKSTALMHSGAKQNILQSGLNYTFKTR